ncbi:MAG: InlB B-repeat-containing protein [Lachnospiraceae bacterium]
MKKRVISLLLVFMLLAMQLIGTITYANTDETNLSIESVNEMSDPAEETQTMVSTEIPASETETGSIAEATTEIESESEIATEIETEKETETEIGTETETITETETEIGTETETETISETETETETTDIIIEDSESDTESDTKSDTESDTETEVLSEISPQEAISLMALGDPIQVPDSTNYFVLDTANAVLKTPADFGIGKMGELEFALKFLVTVNDIPEVQRSDIAVTFTIPAGFSVLNMPSISDVTFSQSLNADGSRTVTAICGSSVTASMVGQFTIRQNATTLLNSLSSTQGIYNFDMQIYTGYGTANQVAVSTPTSQSGYTSRLLLQGSTVTPTFTITNISDAYTFMPGELPRALGQTYYSTASASFDALGGMYANATGEGKGFTIKVHKTEGYLTNDCIIQMMLPHSSNTLFKDRNVWYTTYETDDGISVGRGDANNGNLVNILNATTIGSVNFGASTKSGNILGNDYASPRDVSGLSYADIYYKAGTLTLTYYPNVYYNRLYDGDWSTTNYTADSGCTVTYKDFSTGANVTTTGDPLDFHFVNGTTPISAVTRDLSISTNYANNLTTLAQYGYASSNYNDSVKLSALSYFSNVDAGFQIQDNLNISYAYEEAISPVWIGNLGTSNRYGLTYRISITDAATGEVVRIETLVDEESWNAGYTPQTFGTITETAVNGSTLTEWTLTDADTAGNTNYVSKIEVLRTQFEYNLRGTNHGSFTIPTYSWFDYKLRAYHARLSDGTDIPDQYPAKIIRTTSSDQILVQNSGPLSYSYPVTTTHLNDNLKLESYSIGSALMEVNDHEETGVFGRVRINKQADTMLYNVDSDGNTILFGSADYNPVVLEFSGDGITLTDRMERSYQRLLGVWDKDGIYYDLASKGIDAEKYLVTATCAYGTDIETTSNYSSHDYAPYSGQLYKMDAIYAELGIDYAVKIVTALDTVNSWATPYSDNRTDIPILIHKVMPGYLNYDGIIGTNGSTDLPKNLSFTAAIYCEYSDYLSEKVSLNPAKDSNGGTLHGTANSRAYGTARLITGAYSVSASILDQDYYVDPYSALYADNRGRVLSSDYISNGVAQTDAESYMELTRVDLAVPATLQMQYKQAEIDFTGTDEKLLSLTNAISFPFYSRWTVWDFNLEYTLSNGEAKSIDSTLVQYALLAGIRTYYTIPDVDIANGVYLTSLKVTFDDDINWGSNGSKVTSMNWYQYILPSVGLAMNNVNMPETYPGTTIAIGSVSDHETDDTYDKLTVAARVNFTNIFGEDLTSDESKYLTTGSSARIAGQIYYIDALTETLTYSATSVNQGSEISVYANTQWRTDADAVRMFQNNDIKIRPTYYFKVNKDFTYIDGSVSNVPEGTSTTFIPAGTGSGESGDDAYGILKISYANVDFDDLAYAYIYNPSSYAYRNDNPRFRLMTRFDADPVSVAAVSDVWMDTEFDANRDGNSGNEIGIVIETSNSSNMLSDSAPFGDVYGNTTSAKNSNSDGTSEMLFTSIPNTIKVNEQAVLGVVPYAIATAPYQESVSQVSSRDLTDIENLFSERIFMSGDTTTDTYDWEIYVPIMKKGEQYKYNYGGVDQYSDVNAFSVDLMGVDTSDLDSTTNDYRVYYTTDTNPASGAMSGVKAANWVEFKNSTGDAVTSLPDDLSQVTMIKVTIDKILAKDKIFFDLSYKLNEHKQVIGTQTSQNAFYANFKMSANSEYYFGDRGQSSVPLSYNLLDMEVTGYVWEESDYNSVYDASNSTQNIKYVGAQMELYSKQGVLVEQTGNTRTITDTNGVYSLYMPNDGEWDVLLTIPSTRGLVKQNFSGDIAVDSAFDRISYLSEINFTPDVGLSDYTMEHVNAGIYIKPVIAVNDFICHAGTDHEDAIKVTVANEVPNADPAAIALKAGEATNIAELADNRDATADVSGRKSGVVKGVTSVDDGYGGFITKEFKITVYTQVFYDGNTATGGTAPEDTTFYYPSIDEDTGLDVMSDLITIKDQNTLVKTGYHFMGWAKESESLTADYEPGDEIRTGSIDEDIKLYAVWAQNAYEIAFDANGGIGTMVNQKCTFDVSAELNDNLFTRTGYDFVSWNTTKDGTGTTYSNKQTILNLVDNGTITLYAQWKPYPYTVIYDANSGTGSMDSQVFQVDEEKSLSKNLFVKDGYKFGGWSYESDGAIVFVDEESVKNLTTERNGIVTLFAVWTISGDTIYTVEYYLQQSDGTYETTATSVEQFTGMTNSTATALVKKFAGYVFDDVSTSNIISGLISGDGSLVLKLYYRLELTVSFDTRGGSENPSTQTVLYGEQAVDPGDPTKEGYTFGGWFYANEDGTEVLWDFSNSVLKSMTLFAKWNVIPVPLTINQSIQIQKVVQNGANDTKLEDRTFTFNLTPISENAPMPEGTANAILTKNIQGEGTFDFKAIQFTEADAGKTYQYQVTEVDTAISGYTYDNTAYIVQIAISYNTEETALEKTVKYMNQDGQELAGITQCLFTNRYKKKAVTTTTTTVVNTIYTNVILPLTSDDSKLTIYLLAICSTSIVLIIVFVRRRRKRNRNN